MAQHTANEQYLLELINRMRLDPLAEMARYNAAVADGSQSGTPLDALDQGLAPGSIDATAKQPLAANALLQGAASGHSQHMLDVDLFDHDGIGDGTIGSRANDAGYSFNLLGENIAWAGTTGTLDAEAVIDRHHFGLFRSDGHRGNLLHEGFSEAGLAQEIGEFTDEGTDFNASMLTQKFGHIGSQVFLTGVAYADGDEDGFYTPGEGQAGIAVSDGATAGATQAAGGYQILTGAGLKTVTIGGATVSVEIAAANVKIDLVDGAMLQSSASVEILSGLAGARLLGFEDLALTGSDADEHLVGNRGANALSGGRGADTIEGGDGDDDIAGGMGADEILGGAGVDLIRGNIGEDVIHGEAGDDLLRGQKNADLLDGGDGHDNVKGGGGNDTLIGGEGNDFLQSGTRRDLVHGDAGDDKLIGRSFDDTLIGGTGDDRLNGGGENDRLDGGTGDDVLKGGAGADVFVFDAGFGTDRIMDFDMSEDRLEISAALADGRDAAGIAALAQPHRAEFRLDFGDGNLLRLQGPDDVTGLEALIDIV